MMDLNSWDLFSHVTAVWMGKTVSYRPARIARIRRCTAMDHERMRALLLRHETYSPGRTSAASLSASADRSVL